MPLHRFVAGGNTYNFDMPLTAYSDNFADAVTRTTRQPGVDGGFDEYLGDVAAREIGTIRQGLTLQSETKEGLSALRDDLRAMLQWGKGYLYYRPSDYPTDPERRVYCRVSNIPMSRDESDARDSYWQRATVIFQASYPGWERAVTLNQFTHTGLSTDVTLNNAGNAIALARVEVSLALGDSITTFFRVRRVDGSDNVLGEFYYPNALTEDDLLVIDANSSSLTLNGDDAYSSNVTFKHPDWIRLLPGDNTIRVMSGGGGNSASVTVQYRSAYI